MMDGETLGFLDADDDAVTTLAYHLACMVDCALVVRGFGVGGGTTGMEPSVRLWEQITGHMREALATSYPAPSQAERQEALAALQRYVDDYRENLITEAPTWLKHPLT